MSKPMLPDDWETWKEAQMATGIEINMLALEYQPDPVFMVKIINIMKNYAAIYESLSQRGLIADDDRLRADSDAALDAANEDLAQFGREL